MPNNHREDMKHTHTLTALVALLTWAGCSSSAQAQDTGHVIPFQGQLADQAGQPLNPTVPLTLVFRLYNAAVGSQAIWEEAQPNISVNSGRFSVLLGAITALPGETNFNRTLYLGITVDDGNPMTVDVEMRPRQALVPVVSAKYAQNANKLNGFDWGALFVSGNDPVTGKIAGNRISADGSFTTAHLQTNVGLWSKTNTTLYYPSGNVGVGVIPTNANVKLEVRGTIRAGGSRLLSIGSSVVGEEVAYNTDILGGLSGGWQRIIPDAATSLRFLPSGGLTLNTAPSGSAGSTISWIPRLSLTAAGNVGIGTTTPTVPLQVQGAASVSGNLNIGGATTITGAASMQSATVQGDASVRGVATFGGRVNLGTNAESVMVAGKTPIQFLRVDHTFETGTTRNDYKCDKWDTTNYIVSVVGFRINNVTADAFSQGDFIFVYPYKHIDGWWRISANLNEGSSQNEVWQVFLMAVHRSLASFVDGGNWDVIP